MDVKQSIQRTRLSTLLEGRSPHEATAILKSWDDALTSTVFSIPDPAKSTFKVTIINGSGRKTVKEIPDEIVMDTPELQQWLDRQHRNACVTMIQASGNFDGIPASLVNDDEMFLKLAEARRKFKSNQRKKTRPAPPTGKNEGGSATDSRQAKAASNGGKPTTDKPADKQTQTCPSTPPAAPGATDQPTPDTTA